MKKILAILLCVAMCFALAACVGNPFKANSNKQAAIDPAAEPSTTPEEPSTEANEPAADGKMSMEAFIETLQDQLDSLTASLEASGMKLDVMARGNSLVYSYQFSQDVGDVKDSLEQSMEGLSSTFEGVLSTLKVAVSEAESVIVEYLDKDGNVITSKEYK